MQEKNVYLGLGSNVGNRIAHLRAGLAGLRERGLKLRAISSFYLTEPDLRPGSGGPAEVEEVSLHDHQRPGREMARDLLGRGQDVGDVGIARLAQRGGNADHHRVHRGNRRDSAHRLLYIRNERFRLLPRSRLFALLELRHDLLREQLQGVADVLVLIFASLFSALAFLIRDRGRGQRVAAALTWRIGLSLTLFLLLMAGYYFGIIEPHGLAPPR